MSKQTFDLRTVSVLGLAVLLAGCVEAPPRRVVVPAPQVARIIIYPAKGQSPQQLDRDRYECNTWAVQQTGFDPSLPGVPAGQRVVVEPATPPGANTAVGAIAGAILGAAIAGPRNAGVGLLFGGVTGAAIGASTDANAQARARAEQLQANRSYEQTAVAASNYRRAIDACLHARGYTTG
ncbi:MAG: glycine zipper 2TM domain-containing protein [Steroidobacteraceae bacterium]